MKTLILLFAVLTAPLRVAGQGQIIFANDSTTRFTTNGSALGLGVGNMTGFNAYRIGLYTAPFGTTTESLFTLTAVATNSSSPIALGLFSHPQSPYTLAGNNATPIAIQIKAWSLFAGASYEQAFGSGGSFFHGKTPIGTITPAIGGAAPPSIFGAGGTFTSGIQMVPYPFPEPSVYALAGLAALSVYFGRKLR